MAEAKVQTWVLVVVAFSIVFVFLLAGGTYFIMRSRRRVGCASSDIDNRRTQYYRLDPLRPRDRGNPTGVSPVSPSAVANFWRRGGNYDEYSAAAGSSDHRRAKEESLRRSLVGRDRNTARRDRNNEDYLSQLLGR